MAARAYPIDENEPMEPTAWTEWAKGKIQTLSDAIAEARIDQAHQRDLVAKLEEVIKSHEVLT